ncbi:MAG: type II toxin-antitoxin system HipA family toxin [Candidatus Gastranaerophilales bacterium]
MNNYKSLKVLYNGKNVGTLAITSDNLVAFQYDEQWLVSGFSISPFSLPLEKKVFIPKFEPLDGLFGVFNDSLPDGWGRLLVDRFLLKNKIEPQAINNLNRLALVDNSTMGALTYFSEYKFDITLNDLSLDELSKECENILKTDYSQNLDELFAQGGSSGGARPKIHTKFNDEDWIIKFPSSFDLENIGQLEYDYSICAKECGIIMPETNLFESKIYSGYFGVKRFDRQGDKKKHMVSVSGLLETTHRLPNLDYNLLMKLTLELTKDYSQIEQMFRLMCFNVFSHNRDDHSKNFSFLYEEKQGWKLSPAYDLTYSSSINGEHATTINGEGKNPSKDDILAVAKNIAMNEKLAKTIILEIEEKTQVLKH